MPIPKPLNLAGMWVTPKDLDKITWMWRAKCVVNVNKERRRLRVLFVFDLIEGFLSAGASFSQVFIWKRLAGVLQ